MCSLRAGGRWRRRRSTGTLAREARGRRGGSVGGGAEGRVPGLPFQSGFFCVDWGLAASWLGQPPAAAVAAAVIPLIFLLSPLHLPLFHPTLVDVEGGEGQHNEAEDEGDQDNQHQRGGEGLEELLSTCEMQVPPPPPAAPGPRALALPLPLALGEAKVRLRRHGGSASLSSLGALALIGAGLGGAGPTRLPLLAHGSNQPRKGRSPRHPKLLPGVGGDERASEELRKQLWAS